MSPRFRLDQFDLVAGAQAERLGDQFLFGRFVADQDQAGGRLIVVELADEGSQHFRQFKVLVVAGKVRAVAIVAAAAEEEDLDAGAAAVLMAGDHVGVVDPLDIDVLVRLGGGQCPDTVAVAGGGLEVERFRRRLHLSGELRLDVAALARQEGPRLRHLGLVFLRRDAADAGRRTALDLVLQAGPRPRGIDCVGAVAKLEGALEGGHRPVDRTADAKGPK